MKRTILFILAAIITATSFAQNFEGKIVYANTYKSNMPNVTNEQLTAMMGSQQDYYIKGGDYKSIMNGSFSQWQLYINKDNKLYNKMANNETILWIDGAINPDEILKTELNKGVTEILGYTCDELILTCKSGIQKYYFNAALALDKSLFTNHKYGNWFSFVSVSGALPLKTIMGNEQFSLESTATTVTPLKLELSFFALPAGAKTMKSPY